MQNSATPNKRENTPTHQNIKKFKYNSPTSSAFFPHGSGTSFVVDFLSHPRKSPVRVCLNKGRKDWLLVGLFE